MNTFLSVFLTALATCATLTYTYYSILLWRTTRTAAEISRQSAFVSLWAELNAYIFQELSPDAPERRLLVDFWEVLTTSIIRTLLNQRSAKDSPELSELKKQVQLLMAAQPEHVDRVPWLRAFLDDAPSPTASTRSPSPA